MTPFEQQLQKALERRQPSDQFTARVMARVAALQPAGRIPPLWRLRLRMLAAVAALWLVLLSGFFYGRQKRIAQGQAAKHQLLVALRIAGAELRQTRSRVSQIDSSEVVQQ